MCVCVRVDYVLGQARSGTGSDEHGGVFYADYEA